MLNMNITTLGRGGSDTTATALAAVMNAELCEIYTDVEGVFTTDPRLVSNPRGRSSEFHTTKCWNSPVLAPA
jgi:aspartokinase